MGFGDLFIAALVGCLLAAQQPRVDGPESGPYLRFEAHRQMVAAGLAAGLALAFDLLFFAVDELPATVPVAVALLFASRLRMRAWNYPPSCVSAMTGKWRREP
jgi:hypothetical protein